MDDMRRARTENQSAFYLGRVKRLSTWMMKLFQVEICVFLDQVAKKKKVSCPLLGKKEVVARESAAVFGRDVGTGRQ